MSPSLTPIVAIIGGGFSGSLVAAQLLRQSNHPLIIKLIERNPRFLNRGIAYSTDASSHLLNVPASNMSALPDDPDHFLRWGQSHREKWVEPPWLTTITPGSFMSRRSYGEYIAWVVQEAEKASHPEVKLEIIDDEVIGLQSLETGARLSLRSGHQVDAEKVILAVGNFPSADPPVSDNACFNDGRYIANPWSEEAKTGWDKVESCLIVGTGLTMVDWVLSLHFENFRGKIHVISRRGLLPKAHAKAEKLPLWLNYKEAALSVRSLLRQFRALLATPGIYQDNWRGLIDALRPYSPEIWQALPLTEQRRFLRHLRPYWDNHRHRLSPITAASLKEIENSGQLHYHSGRVENFEFAKDKVEVTIRTRGKNHRRILAVDRVMNCTGTECDYRKLQHPLVTDLLAKGLAQPDAISFGLAVAADGAVLDESGNKSSTIYTLGPPQKGTFWETTAVPEIRGQAFYLAKNLLNAIGASPKKQTKDSLTVTSQVL